MQCEWDVAQYLIFSSNGEPLIYYSHLTSIAIFGALLVFTFLRLKAWPYWYFRLLAISYIIWLFCDLVLWANENIDHVIFFWTILNLVEPLIFVFAYLYFKQFVDQKPVSILGHWLIFVLLAPTLVMAVSGLSVVGFDYTTCDRNVVEGIAAYYNYFLEALFLVMVLFKAITAIYKKRKGDDLGRLIFAASGTLLLQLFFLVANFLGTLTGDYVTSQYGHIAVPIFAGLLAFVTIKYESYEPRILVVESLLVALVIALLSTFFAADSDYQMYPNTVALVLSIPLGMLLVRSIRKEVKARQEISKLATELAGTNAKLERLDKMKSEFVSIASHQLRSPLTSIRGYISMVLEGSYGEVNPKMKEVLNHVADASRHMAFSIEDYLNVSRIEAGNMKYDLGDVDVAKLVSDIVAEMMPVSTKKGIPIIFKPQFNGQAMSKLDMGKARQIVQNLIDNALKYTKDKGTITIVLRKDEAAKKVFVDVLDQGIGIAPEEVTKLFEKFERAKNANHINVTGTGLGLYIARTMARAMGGDITAASEGEGKGSTFTVSYPLNGIDAKWSN